MIIESDENVEIYMHLTFSIEDFKNCQLLVETEEKKHYMMKLRGESKHLLQL